MLDYGQLFLSLIMVVGFIIVLAFIVQKFGPQKFGHHGAIKILTSTAIGTRERIALLQAGDTYLLVGITAHNIQTLQPLTTSEANAILQKSLHDGKPSLLTGWFGAKS